MVANISLPIIIDWILCLGLGLGIMKMVPFCNEIKATIQVLPKWLLLKNWIATLYSIFCCQSAENLQSIALDSINEDDFQCRMDRECV